MTYPEKTLIELKLELRQHLKYGRPVGLRNFGKIAEVNSLETEIKRREELGGPLTWDEQISYLLGLRY